MAVSGFISAEFKGPMVWLVDDDVILYVCGIHQKRSWCFSIAMLDSHRVNNLDL